MIIFLGGQIGTGKTTLARGLARHFHGVLYEMDAIKRRVYRSDPRYRERLWRNIPFPRAIRRRFYQAVLKDFRRLARNGHLVIAEELLSNRLLRRELFVRAKKLFGNVLIIWVRSSESAIRTRLHRKRAGHMLPDPLGMHRVIRRGFHPLTEADIIFENRGPSHKELRRLIRLVKEQLSKTR